jgi:hypothetical protein
MIRDCEYIPYIEYLSQIECFRPVVDKVDVDTGNGESILSLEMGASARSPSLGVMTDVSEGMVHPRPH